MRMIFLVLLVSFLAAGCSNNGSNSSDSYPSAVAWNNILYGYSIEEVSVEEIGKQIGEIKRQVTPMPKKNGDSNDRRLPTGSQLFEISGKDHNQEMAIKVNGKYFKASKLGPLN
ncbi:MULTISPECIES: hypothetical protein [unclassified Paenibacillus]|uniref:hypothetical protein n=1 Tax=unclassified Paenibacillus TaxID=185978 RepID=UPI001048C466|nr:MULTISPECIES: hypothetical protein [unclassified Paenibacillus]NIK70787.1 ABC-type glycerol-3-phosphate transport system substrate-binding protein [Paenibacillus sp. BK720]